MREIHVRFIRFFIGNVRLLAQSSTHPSCDERLRIFRWILSATVSTPAYHSSSTNRRGKEEMGQVKKFCVDTSGQKVHVGIHTYARTDTKGIQAEEIISAD